MTSKEQQLYKLMTVMSCARNCVETMWESWDYGEKFPQKNELSSEISTLQEMIKCLEHKASVLLSRNI